MASTRLRSVYDRIVGQQKTQGRYATTTAGTLRFEQSIQNTINQVTFNILTNDGGSSNVTENRLRYTDNFVITAIGFYLMKAGTTTTATQAQIATSALQTYPNAIIFAGAGEASNLEAVYNGTFSITINNYVYIDKYNMTDFRRVPTAQQGVPATGGVISNSGWDNQNYGCMPMEPTIKLMGNGKNVITVNLPIATSLVGTTSQNFLVCIVKGYNELNINAGKG